MGGTYLPGPSLTLGGVSAGSLPPPALLHHASKTNLMWSPVDWTDPFRLTVTPPCPWAWLGSSPCQPVCVPDSPSQGPNSRPLLRTPYPWPGAQGCTAQAGLQDHPHLPVPPSQALPWGQNNSFLPTCASCIPSPHLECPPRIPTHPDPRVLEGPAPGCFLHEPRLCAPTLTGP